MEVRYINIFGIYLLIGFVIYIYYKFKMKDVNNFVEFIIMFLIGIWFVGLVGL